MGATCLPAKVIAEPFYPPNTPGTTLNFNTCVPIFSNLDFGGNLSVDIIPVSNPGCYPVLNVELTYEYTIKVTVTTTVTPLKLEIINPAPVCSGTVDITSTAVTAGSTPGTILTYWTNAAATTAISTPSAITTSGTYYIKSTLGGCSITKPVAVTITTATAPTAVAQTFCNSATVANLVTTAGTNIQWYAALTGGTALAGTTPLVTGTTYYASQTVGTCESTRTAVAVTITTATAPTAVAPTFCTSATVANLVATGTAIQWYAAATGGASLASTTALATGTTYYASQTVGTCESTRTAVAVTITTATAPTAVAQTFCTSATVTNLIATGTAIKWYAAATGGASLASTTALATGTTYYASQTVSGCESARTAVVVTITPIPAPTASTQTFCTASTVANLVATGTAIKWYADLTGGTALATTTNVISGTYYASQTINGCESSRTSVLVKVNPKITPTFTQVAAVCSGETIADLPITSNNGISGTWTPSGTIDTSVVGTLPYTFIPDAGQCAIPPTAINITVNPSNTLTSVSYTVTDAFENNQIITVFATATGNYLYQLDSGPSQTIPIFENVSSGIHTITVSDVNGCSDSISVNDILVIKHPKFFTPNGDGYNDVWNITSLNNQLNTRIYIFDRYGKLLKDINPNDAGWDGTYIGLQMPAGDYWFTVDYLELNILKNFKSHFSLKR